MRKVLFMPLIFFCSISSALAVSKSPLRLGIIHFNPLLDRQKPLAEADYGGWVNVSGEKVIGSVNNRWVSLVDLDTMDFKWWFEAPGSLAMPAGVFNDGYAYLAFNSGQVAKLSLDTGSVIWKTELASYASRKLVKDGNVLFAQTTNGNVYALNIADGKTKWVTDIGAVGEMVLRVGAPPIVAGNQVLLANSDGVLFALDKESGRIDWREFPQNKRGRFVGYVGDLIKTDKGFTGTRYDGIVNAMQANQSLTQWSKNIEDEILTSQALDGDLLIGTSKNLLVMDMQSGEVRKKIAVPHRVSFIVTPKFGYVLASEAGELTAYDKNLNLLWYDDLNADVKTSPFVVGEKLYVSSGLKNLYVYKTPINTSGH